MLASLNKRLKQFFRDESGPTAVEYAVMLALIIIVCLVSIRLIGTQTNSTLDNTADVLNLKTDGNADGNGQI